MYAVANWMGGDKYDVLVWDSEAESVNDDGAKAVRRETVVSADGSSEQIRLALELGDDCEIEMN